MSSHDVFISHCHEDKPFADAACAGLEAAGIRCWIAPRDIIPGMEWGGSIIEAIGGCRVMVVVFSAHANQSKQVLREVERCVSRGVILVPLRVEDVAPSGSMEYFLGTPHWLDALTPPMEQHIARLVTTIKRILETPRIPDIVPHVVDPPITAQPKVVQQSSAGKPFLNKRNVMTGAIVAVVMLLIWLASQSRKGNSGNPSYATDNPSPSAQSAGSTSGSYASMVSLAQSYERSHDTLEAERTYTSLVKAFPDSIIGHRRLAALAGESRYYDVALDQARIWVRLAPRDPFAHNELAWWLLYVGKNVEALSEVNLALQYDKESPDIWDTGGFALARLGKRDESENAFRIAVRLDPKEPDFADHLAEVQAGKQPRLP